MIRATSRVREHGFAAAFIAIVLNLLFFPYLWGDQSLLSGAHDVPSVTDLGGPHGDPARPFDMRKWKLLDPNGSGAIDEPTFALVRHELFVDRQIPLWNPDVAFGAPLAAEMQQQPFYPLALPVALHPSPTIFAIYIVARLFVAGFATYLFMRFFVSFWPALVSGVAFMLGGYFVHYSTMPHLSVETLAGALFLGVEWVLRSRKPWFAVPFLAAVVTCDLLGGMPESSFVTIVFASAYGSYRILSVDRYRATWSARAASAAFAIGCGFACAAVLLIPFAEFVVNSFNIHEPAKNGGGFSGSIADMSPKTSLALYLMPLLFGPPWQALSANVYPNDGYFGAAVVFFAVFALAGAPLRENRVVIAPVLFFATCALALIAKRYGIAAVNWIGYLPIVRMITLVKYDESATAFAAAALAGFGVDALVRMRARGRPFALVATAVVLALVQAAAIVGRSEFRATPHAHAFLDYATAVAVAALVCVAILAWFATSGVAGRTHLWGSLAAAIVTIELGASYLVPMYYAVDPGPPKAQNPYAGAPYIDYLRAATRDGSRIYGERTGELSPDWAEAFDLRDVRNVDALYDERYLPFARAFLPKDDTHDLISDFSGSGNYTMAGSEGRRFLTLGSVRFVLAKNMIDPSSLLGGIRAALEDAAPGVAATLAPCRDGDRYVECLAQNDAAGDVRVRYAVPQTARTLAFRIGAPAGRVARSGLTFAFALEDATGRRIVVSRDVGPTATWVSERLDLRPFAGHAVDVTFRVRGGTGARRGYWAGFEESAQPSAFTIHHVDDTDVFEFASPLPRGAIYQSVRLAHSDEETLATLVDPKFDPFGSAVVSANGLPPEVAATIESLANVRPARVRAALRLTYTARRVDYSVDAPRQSLFVLNDTFYPGWSASVDGNSTPILRANFLFRGVVVGAGKHVITFRYQPISFELGSAISLFGILALATFAVLTNRRDAKVAAGPSR